MASTFPPIVHAALTVSDLDRSLAWYSALFGAEPRFVGVMLEGTPRQYTAAVWREPNFGLHYFGDSPPVAFDERRPGMDHLAFECESVEELERWAARLDELGVTRGEILHEPYGAGLSFRDPDNIALELFVSARRPKDPRE